MAGRRVSGGSEARRRGAGTVPAAIAPEFDASPIVTEHGVFDLEDPVLPHWVADQALASDGHPHRKRMKRKAYAADLRLLQIELVKLQRHVNRSGARVVALFEGRDAAGKGGSIKALRENMNPRTARVVALPRPSERERGQWYFQRYAGQLPAAAELVMFDRSWYNRAGVEPVMGFCSPQDTRVFLEQAPEFESMLVDSGIVLFKFWLTIGRQMQLKRFHARRHDPLKIWKLSPIDYAALHKWDAYTAARDRMFAATHRPSTPWTVVRANDKRRARVSIARHVLAAIDYPGKDPGVVGRPDPLILSGPDLVAG